MSEFVVFVEACKEHPNPKQKTFKRLIQITEQPKDIKAPKIHDNVWYEVEHKANIPIGSGVFRYKQANGFDDWVYIRPGTLIILIIYLFQYFIHILKEKNEQNTVVILMIIHILANIQVSLFFFFFV